MRALFVNEGDSAGTRGQGRFELLMRDAAAREPGLTAAFATLSPLSGRRLRAAGALAGPLWRRDLDLQAARWHALQAGRARAMVRTALARDPADVLHVHPHTAALALGNGLPPAVLSVDSEIWDWRQMAIWQVVRPWSRAALTPSLAAQRRALESAERVVAWTDWARDGVLRAAPRANAVVHHPGLDLVALSPTLHDPAAVMRVLFVGARFARKGGEDLIAAAAPLLGDGRVELDVVSPDPVAPRPGVRVHRLGPGDPRLAALFRAADCFCLPSYGDAAPWVVLEAMACGLAVVGSEVGAIPEFLDGGRAGRVVPAGDVRALRGQLEALAGDPGLRGGLGVAARRRCEQRYDARRNARTLFGLLEAVAASAGRTAPAGRLRSPAGSVRGGLGPAAQAT